MAPPGGEHGRTQHRVGWVLATAEQMGLGEAFAEVGVVLRRNPDRVVGPDAAFVAKDSLPVRMSPEGYLETIPELAIEVRSKSDSVAELESKAHEYLEAGVQFVWVVDASAKTATVYRAAGKPQELRAGDKLTAEPALPGFHCAVSELFA